MNHTIPEIQAEIVDEFSMLNDWVEKYEHLIDLGNNLRVIDESERKDENLIKGCQSRVWLHAKQKDSKVHYTADSDALITKGIIALMLRVFDNQPSDEIMKASLDFIDKIGLKEHLSPNRANGLLSMVKQIKFYALALQAKSV